MSKSGNFTTHSIGVAIFILLEIASLALLKRSSILQDIWINKASHFVMGRLWGIDETIHGHFSMMEQNEALAIENFRLRTELEHYKNLEKYHTEDSLMITFGREFKYTPAEITKISRNSAHNYIILNKGSEDGVKPFSGIISEKGIVGIISSVGKNYSYGLTLMNPNISISSRMGREGAVGPMVWDGRHSDGAVFKDLPLHYETSPGDTVFSSGFSSIFPEGIPLGVTGSTAIADGSTNETKVTLFQDFSVLKYVTIVYNPCRDEIRALENMEE